MFEYELFHRYYLMYMLSHLNEKNYHDNRKPLNE
jgi:hypothetical protein